MLTLSNVNKTFNIGTVSEKKALRNINLEVADGEFITLIGTNGAGKSTLFNAIAGSFITDTGSIILDGTDITLMPDHKRARSIGRLFQDPKFGTAPNMTIEQNLLMAAGHGGWMSIANKSDKKKVRECVARLEMGLEDRMDQLVGSLSGGQRQALTLMMATVNPPKLLLLDECTAALDPSTAAKVLSLIKQTVSEQKLTCLMITHDMQMALDYGNRTLMMNGGSIILDISGEERDNMTVQGLLDRFKQVCGNGLMNDRMLLG